MINVWDYVINSGVIVVVFIALFALIIWTNVRLRELYGIMLHHKDMFKSIIEQMIIHKETIEKLNNKVNKREKEIDGMKDHYELLEKDVKQLRKQLNEKNN